MLSYLSEVKFYLQPLTHYPPQQLGIFLYSEFSVDRLLLRLYRPITLAQLVCYLFVRIAFAVFQYQTIFRFRYYSLKPSW